MDNKLEKLEITRRLKIFEEFSRVDKYYSIAGMGAYLGIALVMFGEKVVNEMPLLVFNTVMVGCSTFAFTKYKKSQLNKQLAELENERKENYKI